MKQLFIFVCAALTASAGTAQDSATFFLHKFAQNIGKETYHRMTGDSGVVYTVHFKFVDRGSAVPLEARMVETPAGDPVSLWIKGNTSRFSGIHDSVVLRDGKAWITVDDSSYSQALEGPAFPVAGYSPGTVQMLLLQYWRQHGEPAVLHLLPTGAVSIRAAGKDTLALYGQRLVLDRMVIHGLIWGNELVWTDEHGNLVCLITNDAEGDKLEMMRDRYETLLPEFIGRAATYGMALFAQQMHGDAAQPQTGTLAVVGGRMVDVATGETTNDAVILIRKGKIVRTGARAAVAVPVGAKIIHAEGKTILPGLWDMHSHFEQAEWGPAYLAAGVTTVRDCGNEFNYINAVKRAIDEGHGVGPHILKAGVIDGPGPMGLGIIRASNPYEARAAVRRYKDSGFVQIKIYSSVKPPIVKAICDEAHRLGLTVTGHIPEGMTLIQGVDSGMDMVNHIQYVGPILARTKDRLVDWSDPKTAAGFAFIKEHGTVIDPTLGVFEMVLRSVKDTITNMEPAFYSLPQPLQVLFRTMGMQPALAEKYKPMFGDMKKMVKTLYDEGVPIVAGTDMGFPGWSVDRELELYVEAGLTPLQAIRTATIVPAMVMKQTAVSGTLMPGRNADLIIVDGDPLHHIRDIRNVRVVVKDGKVYDPVELHRIAGFEVK
ncbi:MAG TPA: amidohydrolase family protein [Puia sp.]|jgi:imidazolonepropionase-like amidohydrolase|nr:amidohydrolase family protein [Puia sp.]